jgi:hypothetical protein
MQDLTPLMDPVDALRGGIQDVGVREIKGASSSHVLLNSFNLHDEPPIYIRQWSKSTAG